MRRDRGISSRWRPARSPTGFSLIETIAAIVIMAVAVPAMLWALSEAHRKRVDPVMTSRALWLASETIEDVIADRHAPSRGWGYITVSHYPAESPVAGFPGFSRSIAIEQTGPDLQLPGSGYKTVTVSVEWSDGAGKSQSLQLSTALTEF